MADKSNSPLPSITAAQKEMCDEYAARFVASPPDSKLGFALRTKGPKFGIRALLKVKKPSIYAGEVICFLVEEVLPFR